MQTYITSSMHVIPHTTSSIPDVVKKYWTTSEIVKEPRLTHVVESCFIRVHVNMQHS